jgi:hypothetical protein
MKKKRTPAKTASPSDASPDLSPVHSKRTKRLRMITIFLFVWGLGLVVWGGFQASRAMDSRRWPSTRGTVIRSYVHEAKTHGQETKTTAFYPRVIYHYSVLGDRYTADRIAFGGVPSGSRAGAKKVVDRYPAGTTVTVYYDPNKPSLAVLEAGYGNMAYAVTGMGVLLLIGSLLIWRRWRRSREAEVI